MADKVVQLKNKDGDNLYPVSVLPGERILWEDTLEVAPEHSEGVNDMIGATATSAGAHGLVPAPAAGDQDKVLKGDGTWASATFDDRYAPITTGVSVQDGSALTGAQCVFNFTNIGGANQYETKIFANAKIANPIGGATIYGVMETKEYISDGNLYIEQIFKRKQYGSIGDQQVFRRLGYIQGWSGNKYTGVTSATITWKTWYPLEYPMTELPVSSSLPSGTTVSKSNATYWVSGGTLYVSIDGLMLSALSGSPQIYDLPVHASQYNGTNRNYGGVPLQTINNGSCLMHIDNDGSKLRIYWGEVNKDYYGTVVVPLGY